MDKPAAVDSVDSEPQWHTEFMLSCETCKWKQGTTFSVKLGDSFVPI